jgi:NADH:ubiquinone oxidoreductase subunit 2 (subunit N)
MWTVDFYEGSDGSTPVESFLGGLPKQQRARVLALIRLLE